MLGIDEKVIKADEPSPFADAMDSNDGPAAAAAKVRYPYAEPFAKVELIGDIKSPYANFVCVSRTVYVGVAAVLMIVNTYASIDEAFPALIAAGTFGVTATVSI